MLHGSSNLLPRIRGSSTAKTTRTTTSLKACPRMRKSSRMTTTTRTKKTVNGAVPALTLLPRAPLASLAPVLTSIHSARQTTKRRTRRRMTRRKTTRTVRAACVPQTALGFPQLTHSLVSFPPPLARQRAHQPSERERKATTMMTRRRRRMTTTTTALRKRERRKGPRPVLSCSLCVFSLPYHRLVPVARDVAFWLVEWSRVRVHLEA